MEAPLPDVLAEVQAWVGRGRAPTRQHARGVLVGLGLAILDGRAGDEADGFARVAAWIARAPEAWKAAFDSELAMAVTEHVRSADARWIAKPEYDWDYVLDARHRLEARLACAEQLQVEVPEELLEAIARADSVLAPHLERHDRPADAS